MKAFTRLRDRFLKERIEILESDMKELKEEFKDLKSKLDCIDAVPVSRAVN